MPASQYRSILVPHGKRGTDIVTCACLSPGVWALRSRNWDPEIVDHVRAVRTELRLGTSALWIGQVKGETETEELPRMIDVVRAVSKKHYRKQKLTPWGPDK